ncbi:hypothetical protein L7F22_066142 [Adiantum nelumboides]|nr:hypothetical protein [Adiantum nelumboides]
MFMNWFSGTPNMHKGSQIYAKLQDLELKLSQQGYSSNLHCVSKKLSADYEKFLLCQHSEKLVIGCALVNTLEGKDICITKNMRVCGDCHAATSLTSEIEKLKIMFKDAIRLHIFECGKCCCNDYF